MESVAPQFAEVTRSSYILQEPVDTPLSNEVSHNIYELCASLVVTYEMFEDNIDDFICVLVEDDESIIRARHEYFIKTLLIMSLDRYDEQTKTGDIFAELLTRKVLTVASFTRVIEFLLKECRLYIYEYDQLFSSYGAMIAPLIISETSSFEFIDLISDCKTLDEDTSMMFFIEILKNIQTIQEPLAVFLLSVAMYDIIRVVDNKVLYPIMLSWIGTNFNAGIIKCPEFVRALTIAIVMACLQSDVPLENSLNHVYVKLLTHFIQSEEYLQSCDIQKRQVQSLFGIQIISAAFNYPEGMIVTLFYKLYQNNVVNKESFDLWKRNDIFSIGFDEDLATKSVTINVLDSYFSSHETNHSNEEPAK